MLRKNLIFGCAVGLSVLSAPSLADPSVTATSGQIDTVSVVFSGGAWMISFRAIGSASSTVQVSAASNEPIGSIQVETNNNSAHRVNLIVSSPSVATVSKSGGNGEFWVTAITTTTGDIGNVTANVIGALDAGDDIAGDITSSGTSASGAPDGISSLTAADSITGDVTAVGRIGSISAPAGTIGTSSSARATISGGSIGDISAKSLFADISSNSGTGEVGSIITTGTGGFTGEFSGSLTALRITGNGLTYGLNIKGDLNANIDHDNAVMATHFKIGGSLVGDILLPANGVTKQIIINANNASGAWTGAIKLNTNAITHDSNGEYAAASVGGGSVGLATFRLHDEACTPPNNSLVYDTYFDPLWQGEGDPPCIHHFMGVTLRHYGPIVAVSPPPETGLREYKVEEKDETCGLIPCSTSWVDVSSQFHFTRQQSASDSVYRQYRITRDSAYDSGTWKVGFRYRITLQHETGHSDNTTLQSVDVTDTPRVPTYVYLLELYDGCGMDMDMRYDQNGDHSLTAEDVASWPGDNPDVSGNGQVTAFDLYKLLCGYVQRDGLPR